MALIQQPLSPIPFDGIKGIPEQRYNADPQLYSGYIDGFALALSKKRIRWAIIWVDGTGATAYYQVYTPTDKQRVFYLGFAIVENDPAQRGNCVIFDGISPDTPDLPAANTIILGNCFVITQISGAGGLPFCEFVPYPIALQRGLRVQTSGTAGNSSHIVVFFVVEDF